MKNCLEHFMPKKTRKKFICLLIYLSNQEMFHKHLPYNYHIFRHLCFLCKYNFHHPYNHLIHLGYNHMLYDEKYLIINQYIHTHWCPTKVETTGALRDYETLISRLFQTSRPKIKQCQGTQALPRRAPLHITLCTPRGGGGQLNLQNHNTLLHKLHNKGGVKNKKKSHNVICEWPLCKSKCKFLYMVSKRDW